MHVWGLTDDERILENDGINLLDDLTEDVLMEDMMVISIEDTFTADIDEWWDDFVSDRYI